MSYHLQRTPPERPSRRPNRHNVTLLVKTETAAGSVESGVLQLILGINTYILDSRSYNVAIQGDGSAWRYTFFAPRVQEYEGGAVKVQNIEEVTLTSSRQDVSYSVSDPIERSPSERISISDCYVWLYVRIKRRRSALSVSTLDLHSILTEAAKYYEEILGSLRRPLTKEDIRFFEYRVVSRAINKLTFDGISYGPLVERTLEYCRTIKIQQEEPLIFRL